MPEQLRHPDEEFQRWARELERRLEALERGGAVAEAMRAIGAAGQPGWENGWGSYAGYAARFYKHGGRVYLDGIVAGGTSGLAMFTLPVGYRPSQYQFFDSSATGSPGRVDVATDGRVIGYGTDLTYLFLPGLSWRIA